MKFHWALAIALAAVSSVGVEVSPAAAQSASQSEDLTKLSLDDLLSTEVTSVAKKPQRVDEAAAAVFVVSQEDIRRSGARTIPDVLRMVPGLEVADLPLGGAAVTARGFNGFSANKLLVLVDGRAIYMSALGGVLWDQQLIPLEDIQRIEVVRGPGATLYGANAVNGVINIVTKHSVDTLGVQVNAQADSKDGGTVSANVGTQLGADATIRLYATRRTLYDEAQGVGGLINDFEGGNQGGARIDVAPTDHDALTFQGDVQDGRNRLSAASGFVQLPPLSLVTSLPNANVFHGADILGRWTRTLDDGSGFSGQLYWDHVQRQELGLTGRVDQINFDFNHHFNLGPRNAVVWGVNYRSTWDDITGTPVIFVTPMKQQQTLYGAFIQDDITVVPERLTLSIGSKFDHNSVSGSDIEPSIRALWRSEHNWSVWAAISRAARTPSRFETDLTYFSPIALVSPNSDIRSEIMTAYEAGARMQLGPDVALDVTAYRQDYSRLISWGLAGFVPPFTPIVQYGNHGHGVSQGLEVELNAKITPTWTVKAGGNVLNLGITPGGLGTVLSDNAIDQGASPRAQASVRSLWNVTDDVDFDLWYRHVGKLETGPVPAYDDLMARLAWRPTAHIELSLIGEHLLSARRIEIVEPTEPFPVVVARQVGVKLAVRY
ncbi:MAG TPA: TonB-dependent receptor [Caulobacteraceae bacterium]|jgi:iron complex outermembrane receptor protein|nr:TonB-dependent receptor [Caulobacteraceae bacterium]